MRILVVEDVRRLADDIAEGLRDQGMAVDTAYDGLDAAAKINLIPTMPSSSTATCPACMATRSAAWSAVTRDGEPIALSAKEFGVLEALLRAAPSVVSPEGLLEQVWDENADPFTKTVQVTIAGCDASSASPRSFRRSPAPGTRSPTRPRQTDGRAR